MKKQLLFIFLLAISYTGWAQTVSIADPNMAGASPNVISGGSTYHAVEAIYLNSEIGATNFIGAGNEIQSIKFACTTTSTGTIPTTIPGYSIYMKNVPTTSTTLANGTYSLSGYTLVFTGSINIQSAGPRFSFLFDASATLTTPFARTAGTNLQVLIIRNSGSATSGTYDWDCSNGNAVAGASALTSRRYNGTGVPAENSTILAPSAFRPAIQLIRPIATDASISSILNTPSPSCFNTAQSISVTLKNTGTSNIAIGTCPVKIDVTGAGTYTSTLSNTGVLAANATEIVTFSSIPMTAEGAYNIKVYSQLPGDSNASNDTMSFTITNTGVYITYPVSTGAELSNPLVFQYLKTLSGGNHWNLNIALTASTTGAFKNADLTDSIYPHSGKGFYVWDSYSGASSAGHRAVLYAGCFSFSSPASISFWMTNDNSLSTFLDSIYVVYSSDKGQTWNRIPGAGFGRFNGAAPTPIWVSKTVDLSSYAGQTIQLGFEGASQYGNVIGLDDIVVTANAPVPVTFGDFTGVRENTKNILKWNTVTENNNTGFELQRSVNGTEFSTIAFVPTKAENGNSNVALQYTYNDNASTASAYYKLKQIDKDGKSSFSKVVFIKADKPTRFELVSVYPNPAKDNIKVSVASPKASIITLSITDITGKVVKQQNVQLAMGDNNVVVDVASLKAGNYIIRLTCAEGCESSINKFIKQ
ncbi:MAG: T9SS type A sorting domain-containing protein [Chitinophagales bacterium]|nr:T9SS type A sorting domain-containing protein [Chitinophagales bacterium]